MADELNIQVAAQGFGAYLDGILPKDIATACGAFSATMQQVKNILNVDFEKFSQVVANIETIKGLPQVNGTDVPVIVPLAKQGFTKTAIGSGPDGAYTISDFFGCMSGLPYLWNDIQKGIEGTQTSKLLNIYNQLFLAVTWEKARFSLIQPYYYITVQNYIAPTTAANSVNPDYQPDESQPNYDPYPYLNGSTGAKTYSPSYYNTGGQPAKYDWYYTLGLQLEDNGGGYTRGTAPNPVATVSPNNVGASIVVTNVGRNDKNAASMGGGTFGRVEVNIDNGGSYRWLANDTQDNWVDLNGQDTLDNPPNPPIIPPRDAAWVNANMPLETVTIQHPPVAALPVTAAGAIATGGTNTTGDVYSRNGLVSSGEQGWPYPMNSVVQGYINQANQEIANIRTTQPYKSVNLNIVYDAAGTQLVIEQRARFSGIPPVPTTGFGDVAGRDDFLNLYPTALHNFVDSIPSLAQDTRPHMSAQTLEAISNLTLPGGQSIVAMMRQERNAARLQEIGIELDNNIPGTLNPTVEKLLISNGTVPIGQAGIPVTGINGNVENPITIYTNPSVLINVDDVGNLVAPIPAGYYDVDIDIYFVTNPDLATEIDELSPIDEILNLPPDSAPGGPPGAEPRTIRPGTNTDAQSGSNQSTTLEDALAAARNQVAGPPTTSVSVGARLPIGNGSPLDDGSSNEPGSLAGSKAKNLLPNTLNATYTSGILTPSIYSVAEAIDEVIKCNCDCWID